MEDIKSLFDRKDPSVEIVLTGIGATRELIEMVDLSTEMENIMHVYNRVYSPGMESNFKPSQLAWMGGLSLLWKYWIRYKV